MPRVKISAAHTGHLTQPRAFGHASATLATRAVFRVRFVRYLRRSRGQSGAGVAKVAGTEPPGEAAVIKGEVKTFSRTRKLHRSSPFR